MADLTPDRLAKLRRIASELRRITAETTPGTYEWRIIETALELIIETTLALLDRIEALEAENERLRRERESALDILSREDIGDGAKVEGVRLILSGDRGWPTRESERARLVAEVGECCRGADPLCAAGCLVEAALRRRLVDKEGTA